MSVPLSMNAVEGYEFYEVTYCKKIVSIILWSIFSLKYEIIGYEKKVYLVVVSNRGDSS